MQLKGDRMPFGGPEARSRPWRVLVLLGLIAGGILLTRLVEAGRVEPLFLPTPTPTRTAFSYQGEAEAHFSAGDLEQAIAAYQAAVLLEPDNAEFWAKLARIQTYSSALMATTREERDRLEEARLSVENAVQADEDSGYAWAIHILVYDWLAAAADELTERDSHFTTATASASRASSLAGSDPLALAFRAELLVDQQNYGQAQDTIDQALGLEADLMDVHRVHGTVLESTGNYRAAIEAYERAAAINPSFTLLYLRIGANYRRLGESDTAIEYFRRAATINQQLGIRDPIPHLAIGRTWLQEGEFITAARNVEVAVSIDPANPELLGFLGISYFKARNYENAIETLECAVMGCSDLQHVSLVCDKLAIEIPECEGEAGLPGVTGLALEDRFLEYYYTYGSVLSFNAECEQAEQIFVQLETRYTENTLIEDIIGEGRDLCSDLPAG
jgi:tetratricopeptide (TPR) repeat protein